jgi:hypothetical protein
MAPSGSPHIEVELAERAPWANRQGEPDNGSAPSRWGTRMSTGFSPMVQSREGPTRATPPSWPVIVAGLCAVAATLLILPGRDHLGLAIGGYCLGALATPLLTVIYRFARQSVAKNPFFVPRLILDRVLYGFVLLGICVGIVHAWLIATELAKR